MVMQSVNEAVKFNGYESLSCVDILVRSLYQLTGIPNSHNAAMNGEYITLAYSPQTQQRSIELVTQTNPDYVAEILELLNLYGAVGKYGIIKENKYGHSAYVLKEVDRDLLHAFFKAEFISHPKFQSKMTRDAAIAQLNKNPNQFVYRSSSAGSDCFAVSYSVDGEIEHNIIYKKTIWAAQVVYDPTGQNQFDIIDFIEGKLQASSVADTIKLLNNNFFGSEPVNFDNLRKVIEPTVKAVDNENRPPSPAL